MNVVQFRHLIVRPVLRHLQLWSEAAEQLTLATILHESGGLAFLDQVSAAEARGEPPSWGPAYGVAQIEAPTHTDLWTSFLREPRRAALKARLCALLAEQPIALHQLATNLSYAVACCRLLYYRRPEPHPALNDWAGLGLYYKRFYNGPGKGTAAAIADAWFRHVDAAAARPFDPIATPAIRTAFAADPPLWWLQILLWPDLRPEAVPALAPQTPGLLAVLDGLLARVRSYGYAPDPPGKDIVRMLGPGESSVYAVGKADGGPGDCEDQVATLWRLAVAAGIPAGALAPAIGATAAGRRHAVLLVETATNAGTAATLGLDPRRDAVEPWHRIPDLRWLSRYVHGEGAAAGGWVQIVNQGDES